MAILVQCSQRPWSEEAQDGGLTTTWCTSKYDQPIPQLVGRDGMQNTWTEKSKKPNI